jgi:hypothetical protein
MTCDNRIEILSIILGNGRDIADEFLLNGLELLEIMRILDSPINATFPCGIVILQFNNCISGSTDQSKGTMSFVAF